MNEDHIFDLVVFGTGVAASTAAHECSSAGWRVSIIDSTSFGGTCALRGCEPKKFLLRQSRLLILPWGIKIRMCVYVYPGAILIMLKKYIPSCSFSDIGNDGNFCNRY